MSPVSVPGRGILVVGAGYLGSAVARIVRRNVVVTRRSARPRRHRPLPPNCPIVPLDLTADDATGPASLASLARGRVVLVCVARPEGMDGSFYARAAERLVTHLPRDALRVVWASSTSACPEVDGVVDAATPGPITPRGRAQRAAEAVVAGGCAARGVPWVVVRLGGLYGPGRPIAGHLRARVDPLPGHGFVPVNLVHLADAARLCLRAAVARGIEGTTLLAVAPDHTPKRLLYARAAFAQGRPAPAWELPPPADRIPRGKRVDGAPSARCLAYRYLHPAHLWTLR